MLAQRLIEEYLTRAGHAADIELAPSFAYILRRQ